MKHIGELVKATFEAGRILPPELRAALTETAKAGEAYTPTRLERLVGAYLEPFVTAHDEKLAVGVAIQRRTILWSGIMPRAQWYAEHRHTHYYDADGQREACEQEVTPEYGKTLSMLRIEKMPSIPTEGPLQ